MKSIAKPRNACPCETQSLRAVMTMVGSSVCLHRFQEIQPAHHRHGQIEPQAGLGIDAAHKVANRSAAPAYGKKPVSSGPLKDRRALFAERHHPFDEVAGFPGLGLKIGFQC